MKKVVLSLVLLVIGAGLFALGWISHGWSVKATGKDPSSSNAPVTSAAPANPTVNPPPQTPQPALISRSDFERLRTARDLVLQAHPDLAAEYKDILREMQAQQAKLDADMIKADPKVAPIVAKLVALRQINGGHSPSAVAGPR